jgi:hypothetical protein
MNALDPKFVLPEPEKPIKHISTTLPKTETPSEAPNPNVEDAPAASLDAEPDAITPATESTDWGADEDEINIYDTL